MSHPALVIGLSGLTGSGKTTLSKLLRKQFRIPVLPVSYLIGLEAKKRGLTTRAWAEFLVAKGGARAVIESIRPVIMKMAKRNQVFIVEGLYRPEDYITVKEMLPKTKTLLINMDAKRESRLERIVLRQKISQTDAEKWVNDFDRARQSIGLDELQRIADVTIHNQESFPRLNQTLLERIYSKAGISLKNSRRRPQRVRKTK